VFTRHSWLFYFFFFFVQSFYIYWWISRIWCILGFLEKTFIDDCCACVIIEWLLGLFCYKKKRKKNSIHSFFSLCVFVYFVHKFYFVWFFFRSLFIHLSFFLFCHYHYILFFGGQHSRFCCCFCCHLFNLFVILLIFDYIFCLFIFYRVIVIQAVKKNIACERAHLSGVVALSIFCTFK